MTLVKVAPPIEQDVDLTQTYDAVIVGSGAAGGMGAHVLTTHGLQVLLLEAGKKLPIEQGLRSMQWPYDHPRRGDAPPRSQPLSFNEYTLPKPASRQRGPGAVLRQGRPLPRHLRSQGDPAAPAGQPVPASLQAQLG